MKWIPIALLLLTAAMARHSIAVAQTSSQDQLRASLPAEADLPGFQQTLDMTTTFAARTPSGSVPAVVRDFASPAQEVLAFELVALPTELDTARFAPSAVGEQTLHDFAPV
jgi:hypothetical protein